MYHNSVEKYKSVVKLEWYYIEENLGHRTLQLYQ